MLQQRPRVLPSLIAPATRVVLLLAIGFGLMQTALAGSSFDRIQVPIRWCAVQGSPAVTNPTCSCMPVTSWVLTARGFRASSSYSNCNTLFRPAGNQGTSGVIPSVQVIADPCDPTINPACAGAQGDIVVDLATNNLTEYFQAMQACRTAWNVANSSAAGLIGVNVRRFVTPAGATSNVAGLGGTPVFCNNASQAVGGQFAVTDDDFTLDYTNYPRAGGNILGDVCQPPITHPATPPCQPQWYTDSIDTTTAHEIGHALSLLHLPGTAMNATVPAPPTMTMGGFGQNSIVCPAQPFPAQPTSQCGTVRLQSICHQNGTIVDPPPVVDEQPFALGDATPEHIDLDLAGIVDDGNTGTASVFWRTAGVLPANVNGVAFEFAIDLDGNPTTGGDPAQVGIGIPLPGVELTGSVTVDVVSGAVSAIGSISRWDQPGMAFLPEAVLGAAAMMIEVFVDERSPGSSTSTPGQTGVSIDFDKNLLLGVGSTYTMRVRAFDPDTSGEDSPTEAEFYLHEPMLPVCELSALEMLPGAGVSVTAGELPSFENVVVWFDRAGAPIEVGAGTTLADGTITIGFTVPIDAIPGVHHVAVMVDGPDSYSSHCALNVLPAAGDPGESAMGGGDQMLVTDFDDVTGEVTVSFPPACEATSHAAYSGELSAISSYSWDAAACDLGSSGTTSFNPGSGSRFWVIVGNNGEVEGSYGRDSLGAERPEASSLVSSCSYPQSLTSTCP